MLAFTSPNIVAGRFDHALARKPRSQYILILTRRYGLADGGQERAVLNFTTSRSQKLALSAHKKRPLIWIDSDIDRDERKFGPRGGMLAALLAAVPPVIKATGRKKMMYSLKGGRREASEVELLLSEEDFARVCYYCGSIEAERDSRFQRCGGQDYESSYWCSSVSVNMTGISCLSICDSVLGKICDQQNCVEAFEHVGQSCQTCLKCVVCQGHLQGADLRCLCQYGQGMNRQPLAKQRHLAIRKDNYSETYVRYVFIVTGQKSCKQIRHNAQCHDCPCMSQHIRGCRGVCGVCGSGVGCTFVRV